MPAVVVSSNGIKSIREQMFSEGQTALWNYESTAGCKRYLEMQSFPHDLMRVNSAGFEVRKEKLRWHCCSGKIDSFS